MLKTIFLVVLFLVQSVYNENELKYDCAIHNDEYQYEYLYSSDHLDPANYYQRKVYTYSLLNVENFDMIKWRLIPVPSLNNTYYIMNIHYIEYLCASDFHLDLFKLRRKINLMKLDLKSNGSTNKNCEWSFEPFLKSDDKDGKLNKFLLWNVEHNEPFYAGSTFFKTINYRRNVFTWNSKPNSLQFVWVFDCIVFE